jgi:DNA-directed RNA polymerase subunit omega
MLYPSIDSLMEKLDSKYTLVTLSAKRARIIQQSPKVVGDQSKSNKPVGKALEEIIDGRLTYDMNSNREG